MRGVHRVEELGAKPEEAGGAEAFGHAIRNDIVGANVVRDYDFLLEEPS